LLAHHEQLEFVALASFLTGRYIMESTGPLTPQRHRLCLDFYSLESRPVDELAHGCV
jgi:hypothetical protein